MRARNESIASSASDGMTVAPGSARDRGWAIHVTTANGWGTRRLTRPDGFGRDLTWLPPP
jgi:hypothetical protein